MLILSDLMGRPVVGPTRARLGRLRDLAVHLDQEYPAVTRLRLRKGRKDLTVSWEQVAGIDDDAIRLGRAPEDIAAGSPDELELWLAEHVLDTQVIDVAGRRLVRVGDVALESEGTALRLAGIEIGRAAVLRRLGLRRLARNAGSELVDWRELHLTSGRGHAVQLRTPAARVHRLTQGELDAVIARLPPHRAAEVLQAVKPATPERRARRRRRYHRILSARRRAPS